MSENRVWQEYVACRRHMAYDDVMSWHPVSIRLGHIKNNLKDQIEENAQ